MSIREGRLEWIYLLYLCFFVVAVLSPSLYRHGYFGLSETALEELTIFIFGLAGFATFAIHGRLMEAREREREKAQNDFQKAQAELINSYAYIGSINRKIDLLKKLADETTVSAVDSKRLPKELFHALAANACAAAGAESALIRFVELPHLRTEREFAQHPDASIQMRVANRDLRALHEDGKAQGVFVLEDGKRILAVPSDRAGVLKGYLLFQMPKQQDEGDVDTALLKVFVNQAEMLYQHFADSPVAALPFKGEVQ